MMHPFLVEKLVLSATVSIESVCQRFEGLAQEKIEFLKDVIAGRRPRPVGTNPQVDELIRLYRLGEMEPRSGA